MNFGLYSEGFRLGSDKDHFNRDTDCRAENRLGVGSWENGKDGIILEETSVALTTCLEYCRSKGVSVSLFQTKDGKYFSILICSGGKISLR